MVSETGIHPDTAVPKQRSRELVQVFVGFWFLGLINNAAYVIMIAGANEIAASAVGLVYFCAIGPTIIVKLTAPYWFHLVSYTVRFWVAAALMLVSFCVVALSHNMPAQLLGVALVAVQGGLGEASALGLCSLHPNQLSLTAWSSGTGFAGIMGYAWVAVLHYWMQLTFKTTLLIATAMPAVWLAVFHALLRLSQPRSRQSIHFDAEPAATGDAANTATEALLRPDSCLSRHSSRSLALSPELELSSPASSAPNMGVLTNQLQEPEHTPSHQQQEQPSQPLQQQQQQQQQGSIQHQSALHRPTVRRSSNKPASQQHVQQQPQDSDVVVHIPRTSTSRSSAGGYQSVATADDATRDSSCEDGRVLDPKHMTASERFRATCALWPYMVPLFVVYFAEYAMQSGTWTAVGFPVTSPEARQLFYLYSNWLYQAGVCISRSSGMLFQANRLVLWIMPMLQCLLLVFFGLDAIWHVWWNWGLLSLCFVAGLLGGAVYVNSFTLMTHEVDPALREFSLSAACVADSIGIAAADLTAILIQGCLFKLQGLTGAAFSCGATKV